MKIAKKALSVFAATLISVGVMSPVAQAQAERIVAPEDQDAYVQEFYQDGDVTPLVDGSGGLTDAEIEVFHQAVRDAQQVGPLNDEIIAGEMLSDKIVLPPQVDKATSDEAEVAVAKQQAQPHAFATTAACQYFPFSPHQVCGAILQRYNQMGGLLSILLDPIGRQIQNPDGVGFHQQFRNGFIFWHPDTGAHAITARNAEVFARNGWSSGWMGYPLGGEVPAVGSTPLDGELNGWVQLFQGGRIYRTPVLQGFQVASINGLILDKWLELGGPASDLGLPIADEAMAADGVGRFSLFQHGVVYWHPDHGAHSIDGAIGAVWKFEGAENGRYGYPTSEKFLDENAEIVQDFSNEQLILADHFSENPQLYVEDGKEYSASLTSFLDTYLGIDWEFGSSSMASSQFQTFKLPHEWDPPQNGTLVRGPETWSVNSPILIPTSYVYNLNVNVDKGLHDFCSNSADIWGIDNPDNIERMVADLRGPCARHDQCYEQYRDYDVRVVRCDPRLHGELIDTCRSTYPLLLSRGRTVGADCRSTAEAMYSVVKKYQAWNN